MRMLRYKFARKTMSITLTIIFMVFSFHTDISFAAVEAGSVPFEIPFVDSISFSSFDPEAFTVPFHLGEIQSKYKGSSNKFVIHIQDAHLNYFAQKKIADIFGYITNEYGMKTINLEGGTGEYDLSVFTDISGGAIREEVADYFLKKGEINAAEYYAVNNPGTTYLWGVENKDLYLSNLKVYRDFLPNKKITEKYLHNITTVLNDIKRHMFTPDQMKLDMDYAAFKSGNMPFKEYLLSLVEQAENEKVDFNKYKNIYLLVLAMEKEKQIDFKKANSERNVLVDDLKNRLSKEEVRELLSKTINFKTQKISKKIFYEYLLKKASEVDVNDENFPQLVNYLEYVSTYDAVERSRVIIEMNELEGAIKKRLFRSEEGRTLDQLSKNLELLKTIFTFSMTKNDYQYYVNNTGAFDVSNYLSFINREAPRFKIQGIEDKGIKILDKYREDISSFYTYSFKRDEAFLENMKFDDLGNGVKGAILMTGGFHTDNLCDLFEKENITYVSLSPKFITKKGYENPYFAMLAGETDQLQQILRTSFARASLIQVASKLNSLGDRVWGAADVDAFKSSVLLVTAAKENNISFDIVDQGDVVVRVGDAKEIVRLPVGSLIETLTRYLSIKDRAPPEFLKELLNKDKAIIFEPGWKIWQAILDQLLSTAGGDLSEVSQTSIIQAAEYLNLPLLGVLNLIEGRFKEALYGDPQNREWLREFILGLDPNLMLSTKNIAKIEQQVEQLNKKIVQAINKSSDKKVREKLIALKKDLLDRKAKALKEQRVDAAKIFNKWKKIIDAETVTQQGFEQVLDEDGDPEEGKTFKLNGEEYVIGALIEEGGVGSVWAASAVNDSDQKIVVKRVVSDQPIILKSLFNEDSIMHILSGEEAAVKTLGIINVSGGYYLLQEYAGVTIGTLAAGVVARDEPILAFDVADKTLKALKAFEKRGVRHYDIKPDNIFYNEEGVLKIGDFGISRFYLNGTDPEKNFAERSAGTPMFIPPGDMVNSHSQKVDLYALGMMLYVLLDKNIAEKNESFSLKNSLEKSPEEKAKALRGIDKDKGYTLYQFIADLISVDKKDRASLWSIDDAIEKINEIMLDEVPSLVVDVIKEKGFIGLESYVYKEDGAIDLDGIADLMLEDSGGASENISLKDIFEVAEYFNVLVVDLFDAIERAVPGMMEDEGKREWAINVLMSITPFGLTIDKEKLLLSKLLNYAEKDYNFIGSDEWDENRLVPKRFLSTENLLSYKVIKTRGYGRSDIVFELKAPDKKEVVVKRLVSSSVMNDILFLQEYFKNEKLENMSFIPQTLGLSKSALGNESELFMFQEDGGENLEEGLILDEENEKVRNAQIMDAAYQVFNDLYKMSQAGFVHHDINPENILYDTTSGSINIINLGQALFYPENVDRDKIYGEGLRETARFRPDLSKVDKTSEKTDIYAAGLTLLDLVEKELPQDALERKHKIKEIISNKENSLYPFYNIIAGMVVDEKSDPDGLWSWADVIDKFAEVKAQYDEAYITDLEKRINSMYQTGRKFELRKEEQILLDRLSSQNDLIGYRARDLLAHYASGVSSRKKEEELLSAEFLSEEDKLKNERLNLLQEKLNNGEISSDEMGEALSLGEELENSERMRSKKIFDDILQNEEFNSRASGLSERDDMLVPQSISVDGESFEITERLGVGGTSVVYKAVSDTGKEIAVKILSFMPMEGKEDTAQTYQNYITFLREYLVAKRVRGIPGIVDVEGLGSYKEEGNDRFFIVQEFAGESLKDVLEREGEAKPYSERRAMVIDIARQVMKTLKAIHNEGVIKVDLNKNNLFYKDGQVKLGDFGFSEFIGDDESITKEVNKKDLTHINTPISYLPENSLKKGVYSRESDMFALGVTLFNLLKPEDRRLSIDGTFNRGVLSSDLDRSIDKIKLRRKGVIESLIRREDNEPLYGFIAELLAGEGQGRIKDSLAKLDDIAKNKKEISEDAGFVGYDIVSALSALREAIGEKKKYNIDELEDAREEVLYNMMRLKQIMLKVKGEKRAALNELYEKEVVPYVKYNYQSLGIDGLFRNLDMGALRKKEKELTQDRDSFNTSGDIFLWAGVQVKLDDISDQESLYKIVTSLREREGNDALNEEVVSELIELSGNTYIGQIAAMALIVNANIIAKNLPETMNASQEKVLKNSMELAISMDRYLGKENGIYPAISNGLFGEVSTPRSLFSGKEDSKEKIRAALENGDKDEAVRILEEVEATFDRRDVIARTTFKRWISDIRERREIPESFEKIPGTVNAAKMATAEAPELSQEELKNIVESSRIADGRQRFFDKDSDRIKNINVLIKNMAKIEDPDNRKVLDTLSGSVAGNMKVVAIDFEENDDLKAKGLENEVEALSYRDGDLIVVVINDKITNEGKRIADEYFNNDTAMEHLLRHEFIEAGLNVDHRLIKRFEMIENGKNALTILNQIMIKHMTEDQMEAVKRGNLNDPGDIFYEAVQVEKIARADRGVLWLSKPGDSLNVVLVPLLADQIFFDGSEYSNLKQKGKRVFSREYGLNTHIVYYSIDGEDAEIVEQIKKEIDDKISNMSEFMDKDKARIVAFTTPGKADLLKGELAVYKDKLSGVVQGEFLPEAQTERFDVVSLVTLGLGLNEWDRLTAAGRATDNIALKIKTLLLWLGDYSRDDDVMKAENVNALVKGLLKENFLMKIKKIDYREIRRYMKAQAEVLESL